METVSKMFPEAKRLILVGDVHGCLEEFDELLKKVQYDGSSETEDRLILVGDLLDRGPDSPGVVQRAQELKAVSVKGNHEYKHLRYRKQRAEGNIRVQMGDDKRKMHDKIPDESWDWIASWPYFLRLAPNLVVVHAGLQRGIAIEHQDERTLTMMRYAKRDTGKMASMKRKDDEFLRPATAAYWTELWTGPESVFYGHYVQREIAIDENFPGVFCWGIDTGACFGKHLTAAVLQDWNSRTADATIVPQFVQVPAKDSYSKLYAQGTYDDEWNSMNELDEWGLTQPQNRGRILQRPQWEEAYPSSDRFHRIFESMVWTALRRCCNQFHVI